MLRNVFIQTALIDRRHSAFRMKEKRHLFDPPCPYEAQVQERRRQNKLALQGLGIPTVLQSLSESRKQPTRRAPRQKDTVAVVQRNQPEREAKHSARISIARQIRLGVGEFVMSSTLLQSVQDAGSCPSGGTLQNVEEDLNLHESFADLWIDLFNKHKVRTWMASYVDCSIAHSCMFRNIN